LSGSVEQISWRCGQLGRSTPTIFARTGLHAPAASITSCVRMVPREVTTAVTRPAEVSTSRTSVKVWIATPRSSHAFA
jgi:hypothetical protein